MGRPIFCCIYKKEVWEWLCLSRGIRIPPHPMLKRKINPKWVSFLFNNTRQDISSSERHENRAGALLNHKQCLRKLQNTWHKSFYYRQNSPTIQLQIPKAVGVCVEIVAGGGVTSRLAWFWNWEALVCFIKLIKSSG